jgi:hypothetical protein
MFWAGMVFVAVVICWHLGMVIRAYYTKASAPRLALGLWALGILNLIAGSLVLLAMNDPLGRFPIILGMLSLETGNLATAWWWSDQGPDWDWHALWVAVGIFFTGLLWFN